MLYFQLPLIKPYVQFSRIRLSNHLLPEAFAVSCLAFWYSFLGNSRNFSGVFSISAISIPSFLQKHDEDIAPSLLQGYVVLAIPAVLRATPTPLQTSQNFGFPYIYELPYCMAFVRVSRATPYGFPCVSPLLPRKSTYWFWQLSL